MRRVAETGTADLFERDGCVVIRVRAQVIQTLTDAEENLAKSIEACGGQRRPLVTNISKCEPLVPEVRHFYSGDRVFRAFSAMGIVVDATAVGRTMGNVYLRIARPSIPTKVFEKEEEAIHWANEIHR
jgi:hypothetical protein